MGVSISSSENINIKASEGGEGVTVSTTMAVRVRWEIQQQSSGAKGKAAEGGASGGKQPRGGDRDRR